jgi:polyhydroxyalkanoate synthesis regulator phasin
MSEDTKRILQMVADGKISVDEAERLMTALGEQKPADASADEVTSAVRKNPKYLRVVVDAQDKVDGPAKVNIRVPMNLLRAGVRLSNLIPDQARDQVNAAMREHGVNFDLSQLKPENVEEMIEQLSDLTVDVDSDDAKVRIFCE